MTRKMIFLLAICIFAFLLVGASLAATEAFDLGWWTVDGGGGTSSGGSYTLQSTIGQPDARTSYGGGYVITGGFWSGISAPPPPQQQLFLPLIRH